MHFVATCMPNGKAPDGVRAIWPSLTYAAVTAVTAANVEALQRCLRALKNRLEPSHPLGMTTGLRNDLTLNSRKIDPEHTTVSDDLASSYV